MEPTHSDDKAFKDFLIFINAELSDIKLRFQVHSRLSGVYIFMRVCMMNLKGFCTRVQVVHSGYDYLISKIYCWVYFRHATAPRLLASP